MPLNDRRKRRKRCPWWFEVFLGFRVDERHRGATPWKALTPSKKRVEASGPHRSFFISLGPDGTPRIRRFGFGRPYMWDSSHPPKIRKQREPLLDVLEEEDEVLVVAELPGVTKQDINVHASGNKITISVDKPRKRYHRELHLPAEVDSKTIKTSYKNGVLGVRLKKQRTRGEAASSQKTRPLHKR